MWGWGGAEKTPWNTYLWIPGVNFLTLNDGIFLLVWKFVFLLKNDANFSIFFVAHFGIFKSKFALLKWTWKMPSFFGVLLWKFWRFWLNEIEQWKWHTNFGILKYKFWRKDFMKLTPCRQAAPGQNRSFSSDSIYSGDLNTEFKLRLLIRSSNGLLWPEYKTSILHLNNKLLVHYSGHCFNSLLFRYPTIFRYSRPEYWTKSLFFRSKVAKLMAWILNYIFAILAMTWNTNF